MTIEQGPADAAAPAQAPAPPEPASGRGLSYRWFLLIGIVIILDIASFTVFPQTPTDTTAGPDCLFGGFPAVCRGIVPNDQGPDDVDAFALESAPPADALVTFHPAISNTILTMWIVMALVLVAVILMVRGSRLVPRGRQNIIETVYEQMRDFGVGIAGPASLPYIPIFVGSFLLIITAQHP